MGIINIKFLLLSCLAASLLPACGGSEKLNHRTIPATAGTGSGDATPVSGSAARTGAGGTPTPAPTAAPTTTPTPTPITPPADTATPSSKLDWDGASFIGSKTLTVFPVE